MNRLVIPILKILLQLVCSDIATHVSTYETYMLKCHWHYNSCSIQGREPFNRRVLSHVQLSELMPIFYGEKAEHILGGGQEWYMTFQI